MSYGRYFEELEVGQTFQHWPGRTITEFDNSLFTLMSMNQHPVHIDEHYAKDTQHARRLVVGPLVIGLVIGMTQADIGGRALKVLEWEDVRHTAPVFHGNTLYAESTIVDKQSLPEQPDRGIVIVETRGFNEKKETVLTLRRKIVIPRKGSADGGQYE